MSQLPYVQCFVHGLIYMQICLDLMYRFVFLHKELEITIFMWI